MSNSEALDTFEAVDDRSEEWLRGALGLADGQSAFPWQIELLRRFLRGEKVQALDIPTGLGKTATMAVWLVARALGAPLPRRLVYVVDRRAVVDQATEVAESLCAWVANEPGVADGLGLGDRPLPISTLRGQHVDNRAWLEDPSSPAIVIGTVDMVGSRLLFSGYGVSPKMRPYHAGLLGADTLVVLDEAHLVPAFEDLLRQVERGADSFGPNEPSLRDLVPEFKLLSLSATGRQTDATTLVLSDDDRSNPIVYKRLTAKKVLSIVDLDKNADDADEATKKNKGPKLAGVLAKQAWEVTTQGSAQVRCLVFCNARKDATAVAAELRNLAKSATAPEPTIELLVGGRRVKERTQARDALARLGFLAGTAVNKDAEASEADLAGHVEKRSLLDLAHRSADAVVLASPTLAGEVAKAFEALRNTGNAAPLCTIAPTSLVFGVWDSRGGSGEKRPRLLRSIIRAWDVEVLHSAAQFNSVWKALSEEQQKELEKEAKAKKIKLSVKCFADAPATFRTDKNQFINGAPNPEARVLGGVLAKGSIERDVTINLVALRGIRGKDATETTEVQKYLLGLALLAATADLELFLREGCLLRYANDDAWTMVPRRGEPTEVSLPKQDQLVAYAMAAAAPFKAKWPKDKEGKNLPLEHEFNLAEAKKLLAKKDDAPAEAQG